MTFFKVAQITFFVHLEYDAALPRIVHAIWNSVFFNLRDQMCLLSSVAFLSLGLMKDCLWYLSLNSVSVNPTYNSVLFLLVLLVSFSRVVTVAWYTMHFPLHSQYGGQLDFLQQLQSFFVSVSDFFELCFVVRVNSRQLYDNLMVLRLNDILKTWSSRKLLSIMLRNARLTLVVTFKSRSNGWLDHVMFLDLFLLVFFCFQLCVACTLYVCTLLFVSKGCYSGIALLKMSSLMISMKSIVYTFWD